jgi:hypothetical protein
LRRESALLRSGGIFSLSLRKRSRRLLRLDMDFDCIASKLETEAQLNDRSRVSRVFGKRSGIASNKTS